MIVIMEESSSEQDVRAVKLRMTEMGYKPNNIRFSGSNTPHFPGDSVGESSYVLPVEKLPGVVDVVEENREQTLARRESHPENTVVRVGNVSIGDGNLAVIAGPCAVESKEQTLRIAEAVQKSGAQILRGGAFKPRTSPYSFQGLGERGLEILAEARELTGLPVVTEVLDPNSAPLVAQYADMIQIGARNMQNFSLLEIVGQQGKPVLLKRGMSATLEEVLLAAEYIMSNGCHDVVVCERGIRTFSNHSRNTLDLGIIPIFKKISHLPIIVDPSHASGNRDLVPPLSYAAAGAGADGIIVDVHYAPEEAKVDGPQAIVPEEFTKMIKHLKTLMNISGKSAGAT